jgi:hypothetical protein
MKRSLRAQLLKSGLVSTVFLTSAVVVFANTIHVPKDQPTIQKAISAAANGDTVLVSSGTYRENIDFSGKAITVTSVSGAGATVIDGGASANPVVTFQSHEGLSSELTGFTIRNGAASFGSGIYLLGASATIVNNYFYGNNLRRRWVWGGDRRQRLLSRHRTQRFLEEHLRQSIPLRSSKLRERIVSPDRQ